MNQICTGNPDQLWEYDEPNEDGSDRHVVKSEKEILREYGDYWYSRMKEISKEDLISEVNCIDDWIIVNWASKVNMEEWIE